MGKMKDKALLDVCALGGGYKTFCLKDISFSLPKGGFTGIIGPNGSGKSTLMKMLLGDLKPAEGDIFLDGQDLVKMNVAWRASKIAVVTQHIEDTSMTVLEYVLLGRLPFRKPFQFFEKKADIALSEKYMELTGVLHYRDQPLSNLSGGERQLAAVARALAQEPRLLLLDEPTSQLDICHQVQVLDLVRKLNRDFSLSVLMIIHDLNLAAAYCDNLLLMHKGRLHLSGTPEKVLTPEIVEEVYRTKIVTQPNPVSGRPTVFLVPNGNYTL